MSRHDDPVACIERFNDSRGGGVVVEHRRGGYTLLLEATGAPIARLKPVGENDHMRVLYWSHRDRWADAAPLGGIISLSTTPSSSLLKNPSSGSGPDRHSGGAGYRKWAKSS